jgi:hypothetical protein
MDTPTQNEELIIPQYKYEYKYKFDNSLVPLTTLANSLGVVKNRYDFDETDYIPTTLHACKDLMICKDYQRLINVGFIKKAKIFDPTMISPMIVYRRPDGTLVIVDGQHEGCLAVIYTQDAGDTRFPCMVFAHPENFTKDECVAAEASHFRSRQKLRTNLGAVESLRAGIAAGDTDALEKEEILKSLCVCIENIGDIEGNPVYGLAKLLEAYTTCGLSACEEAIGVYNKFRNNPIYNKWNLREDMKGALILGLAKVIWFKNNYLGNGDKKYALDTYIDSYLGKKKPEDLHFKTAGIAQAVIISRRIIDACNTMIEIGVITKSNGAELAVTIGPDLLEKAGMSDPSAMSD